MKESGKVDSEKESSDNCRQSSRSEDKEEEAAQGKKQAEVNSAASRPAPWGELNRLSRGFESSGVRIEFHDSGVSGAAGAESAVASAGVPYSAPSPAEDIFAENKRFLEERDRKAEQQKIILSGRCIRAICLIRICSMNRETTPLSSTSMRRMSA